MTMHDKACYKIKLVLSSCGSSGDNASDKHIKKLLYQIDNLGLA